MGLLDGALTTIAFCTKIERSDGAGLALTSHDSAVARGGDEFDPAPGMLPASVVRRLGLEPHSSEITAALGSDSLSEEDLFLGRWNGASMSLSAIDWNRPEEPSLTLLQGRLGEVACDGNSFTAELQGAAAKLEEPVCPATSPECRASFGDAGCRVDLAGRSKVLTVVGSNGNQLQLSAALTSDYVFGQLRYLRGANCGLSTVILSADGANIAIRDVPRAPVETGVRVRVREGCDKSLATCASRFANAENFRGEPHLPGNDLLTRYPGS